MKKQILLQFILISTLSQAQSNKSILFIGNSYTYVNNLPQLVHDLAITTNDTLFIDSYTPGGYTLQGHSADPSALLKIAQQPWDYVVLQEQSQLPSFSPGQVATDVYPYAKKLDSLILANDSCTKTIFYMTWGRKYGDAGNCPFYPPVCTYAGMQARLRESYMAMADSNMAWVSPVGAAFRNSIEADSTLELYQGDFSHPSLEGSYLAACVFYARLYKKNPVGNSFISTLNPATAAFLQNIAKITVLDSISLWNEGKFEPQPSFTTTAMDSLIQVTNQTSGTGNLSYLWDFGDGVVSTNDNPNHIYAAPGIYTIKQIVFWRCYSDTIVQNITVSFGGTSGVDEYNQSNILVYPSPVNDYLYVDANHTIIEKLSLIDVCGKSIPVDYKFDGNRIKIDFTRVVPGVYFLRIVTTHKNIIKKIIRQK